MSTTTPTVTAVLPFRPDTMTTAQLAAVSYLARYTGHTHELYAAALRRWFGWCDINHLDALTGIQRAHLELYIRHLHESGLRDSSVNTMMHDVRGFLPVSPPTPRSTPGSRESTPTRPAPKGSTGSS